MIGIIIAIIIVLVFGLILLSSLTITLNISENILFSVRVWGITIFKINPKKQTKNKGKVKTRTKEIKKKRNLQAALKDYAKGKTRKEVIEEIFNIIKELCLKFMVLLKHVRFKRLQMNLSVATSDAASTAILYGSICSIVYSICGMLSSGYNFDAKKIKVSADFASEQMQLCFFSTIKIKIIYVVKFLITTAISIIKQRLGEIKNGRA